MNKIELISIGEVAKMLGISIQTLRRWDESGQLIARKTEGGQRRYLKSDIQALADGKIFQLAHKWVSEKDLIQITSDVHCKDRSIFEGRLQRLNGAIVKGGVSNDLIPLIITATGEIGNNSFDHNLGKWPDVPGIFFDYNINEGVIVLADRGLGILSTLQRVRPELMHHVDALKVAFTEIVTGRAPEKRGNGLKYVKEIVKMGIISIKFQTGNAVLTMGAGDLNFEINLIDSLVKGTIVIINFKKNKK